MSHYPHDQDVDPLLSGDFAAPVAAPQQWPEHDTSPAPLLPPSVGWDERNDGRARHLDALRDMLHHGTYHVMPAESCSAMLKVAGQACLEKAFELRISHPHEDTAELAAHLVAMHQQGVSQACDMNKALRIASVLAHVPVVDLTEMQPTPQALASLHSDIAERLQVLPLMREADVLLVALGSPMDGDAQRMLRFASQCRIVAVLAQATQIHAALPRCYGSHTESEELESLAISAIEADNDADEQRLWSEAEALARQAPIVRLVNNILSEGISRQASDIHLRPGPQTFQVLYRIHGTLVVARTMRRALLPPVVGRIKILASMNSAEHRLPQDGRIRYSESQADVDLRISIIPSQFGESVVIRVLARRADMRNLDAIGFESTDLARLRDLLRRSMGIVLVTGPTGSGKTTTLYAALQEVAQQNVNIITVEDPIEYELENIIQIQANPVIQFTFPRALRHILRHDPDVILIGEMRDFETAKIAVESALTGHLVFSTLHTNDAPSALVRLIEMGVEPYLIRSAVIGVLAQRLVRSNCPHCRVEESVDVLMRSNLGVGPDEVFYRGAGCEHCHGTGFSGRQAIYELMTMDKALAQCVGASVAADVYRESAAASGMVSLAANGVKLARTGAVSLAEVYRACM
ncbi:GspE/PulE family protein [Curvibacter sp. APW13]|uniref:GspE/PulE family protein n=1 Tax=Curvibacter sp. APW13 TaxID=3077236 RepID=UPI0028DE33B4|nr:GspE/PulE family protein [Curvibacter sp. APW13]MDT8989604.1 GspE/PulE family protein [Curvibacter sp. APW13]